MTKFDDEISQLYLLTQQCNKGETTKAAALNAFLMLSMKSDWYFKPDHTNKTGIKLLLKKLINARQMYETENYFLSDENMNLETLTYRYIESAQLTEAYRKVVESKKYETKAVGEAMTYLIKCKDEATMLHILHCYTRLDSEIYRHINIIEEEKCKIEEENRKIEEIEKEILKPSHFYQYLDSCKIRIIILLKFLLKNEILKTELVHGFFQAFTREQKDIRIPEIEVTPTLRQIMLMNIFTSLTSPDKPQNHLFGLARKLILGETLNSKEKHEFELVFMKNTLLNFTEKCAEVKPQQTQPPPPPPSQQQSEHPPSQHPLPVHPPQPQDQHQYPGPIHQPRFRHPTWNPVMRPPPRHQQWRSQYPNQYKKTWNKRTCKFCNLQIQESFQSHNLKCRNKVTDLIQELEQYMDNQNGEASMEDEQNQQVEIPII